MRLTYYKLKNILKERNSHILSLIRIFESLTIYQTSVYMEISGFFPTRILLY